MQGLMMDMPLLVSGLIKHADRFAGRDDVRPSLDRDRP